MDIGKPLYPGHWSMGLNGPEWKGPEMYLTHNMCGPFGRLQSDLHWTLNVYIRLHQSAYASFREQDKWLDQLASELKVAHSSEPEDFERHEELLLGRIRRMDWIFTEDQDLARSVQTINQMLVVTLWALAE
jgi:hypothetical protein